jgi:hypothetical protein
MGNSFLYLETLFKLAFLTLRRSEEERQLQGDSQKYLLKYKLYSRILQTSDIRHPASDIRLLISDLQN